MNALELSEGISRLVLDPRVTESMRLINETHEQLFKKYDMKNFKLEDLETGMRVDLANGMRGIVSLFSVTNEGPGAIICDSGYKTTIGLYAMDMTYPFYYANSIKKVYRAPKSPDAAFNPSVTGEILWERKIEIPELTMAEAIEKVGFEFKIKKG